MGSKTKDAALAVAALPFIATIYVCAQVVEAINELGSPEADAGSWYSAGHDAMLGWLEKEKEGYRAWVKGL